MLKQWCRGPWAKEAGVGLEAAALRPTKEKLVSQDAGSSGRLPHWGSLGTVAA